MDKNFTAEEIKSYSSSQLNILCDDLRKIIFDTVTEKGGHLASNLGAVESTVALFKVFDFPKDKIVFDVGHQCYSYKLLSGRYDRFSSLRQRNGISGFPKREESEYDSYNTGHAGTSVSAAIGLAKARDLSKEDYTVIAYIGDGSFNNGLIYEALNSLKILNTKILIVLNDNGMSISPTEGGVHDILDEIKLNRKAENIKLLESFSLKYIGVKNGNDVDEMVDAFSEAKTSLKDSSVLLHILTKKGKGYAFSEEHPENTHGVSPKQQNPGKEYSSVLGETLISLAKKNPKICAVTAAMTDSLGLREFFNLYPERSFDVGICEEHASVLTASLSVAGYKPYYAIYSTFLERTVDEIIHDVASQNLPVCFCIDRAGISGADGETHQGVFDLSYLTMVPNLTVACPKDLSEFAELIRFSETYPSPLAIRYPRSGKQTNCTKSKPIKSLSWQVLTSEKKSNVVVLAVGERMITLAEKLSEELSNTNVKLKIVNCRFVKPIDEKLLRSIEENHIITLEDNVKAGGFGEKVCGFMTENGLLKNKTFRAFAYDDKFIPQGTVQELQRDFGLNEKTIKDYLADLTDEN